MKKFALWTVFFASGAAALGWQILWGKLFALSLGHEFASVVAVVVSFFAGMAIGGWLSSRRVVALWVLEAVIGLWGLFTPYFVSWSASRWTVLLMLPATIAMGATLPAMSRLAKSGIAGVYGANTFGGVIGCLLTAFLLLPRMDFGKVSWILAALNFFAAALATRFQGGEAAEVKSTKLGPIFLATGFLALGFEVVGVRLLSQSVENTIYSFAAILAVYLFGQAAGAAVLRKGRVESLLMGLAVMVAGSVWTFHWSGSIYGVLRNQFGDSPWGVLVSELLVTLAVFGAPTFLMGGLFVVLAERAGERSLGRAIGWNSLGAGLGAAIFPALILPTVGGFWCVAILAAGYLCLVRSWCWRTFVGAGIAVVILASGPRPLTLARIPPGQKLYAFAEGRMANALVTEAPDGHRTLFVNNRFQMGGTAARIPELRHAHIPLLLAREPKRVLFIGLGTGISLSGAGAFPEVQADGVELLPEVAEMIPHFVPAMPSNVRVLVADARRFVRESTNLYDVIVGDLFHPAAEGAGFLYTVEHFNRVKARLSEGGLFCQWLPLHQLDLENVRVIARTFLEVFPEAEMWLLRPNIDAPVVSLVGWRGARGEIANVEPRINDELKRVGLTDSVRLYGNFLAGPAGLKKFAGDARLNRDFFPIVVYEAPRFSFQRHTRTHERLMALVEMFGDSKFPALPRVEKYIQARNVYLRALVTEADGNQQRAIDGYVESARMNEDFTLGYAQCLALASAWLKGDPKSEPARELLERLVKAQPKQRVAKDMLERLGR